MRSNLESSSRNHIIEYQVSITRVHTPRRVAWGMGFQNFRSTSRTLLSLGPIVITPRSGGDKLIRIARVPNLSSLCLESRPDDFATNVLLAARDKVLPENQVRFSADAKPVLASSLADDSGGSFEQRTVVALIFISVFPPW